MDEDGADTLLVIGRQIRTTSGRRLDLVAIDSSGGLILIEVKRDADDVKQRKDHAEIQAVRYAASLARLKTLEEIVTNLYGPYIAKYCREELESSGGTRTAEEWARKKLLEFMDANEIDRSWINHRQQIVLIGAGFDDDTRSAAAWMARNQLPIRVIELQPVKLGNSWLLNVQQIIPVANYEDLYVDVMNQDGGSNGPSSSRRTKPGSRKTRIRLPEIFDSGRLSAGDEIYFRKTPEKRAALIDGKSCRFNGDAVSILQFAKSASGWSGVNIYDWIVHVPSERTLEEIRIEIEQERAAAESETTNDQPSEESPSEQLQEATL
ncbi:hypothetical protein GC176_08370 [bacterium]|nr:hypothetical protein [bacterium]